jgi:hypothetical protein
MHIDSIGPVKNAQPAIDQDSGSGIGVRSSPVVALLMPPGEALHFIEAFRQCFQIGPTGGIGVIGLRCRGNHIGRRIIFQ